MIDDRLEVDADLFAYRPLDGRGWSDVGPEMIQPMRDVGAQWLRATLVSPAFEKPPYPHGWYIEGWLVRPDLMEVPSTCAPFNFPLTDGAPT